MNPDDEVFLLAVYNNGAVLLEINGYQCLDAASMYEIPEDFPITKMPTKKGKLKEGYDY